jgi:hypothetical protein
MRLEAGAWKMTENLRIVHHGFSHDMRHKVWSNLGTYGIHITNTTGRMPIPRTVLEPP